MYNIPDLKKKENGETYYNFRAIQIIITLLTTPIALTLGILIHWTIPAFIYIWLTIGIIQIQTKYINKGVKYAPKNF